MRLGYWHLYSVGLIASMRNSLGKLTLGVCLALGCGSGAAADASFSLPPLDHGFQLLYNLDFDRAHNIFVLWEQSHPDDPMGPTADAAGLLFSEFHRLGVL